MLIDIDYDEQTLEQTVKEQIVPAKVDKAIFDRLSEMKISAHWFMDHEYSDEFQTVLKELKSTANLDKLVEENIEKVFYEQEKYAWYLKLIMASYIKLAIGKDGEASEILGLAVDENLKQEFFKTILQQSIYEYLMVIKYNKDVEHYGLTIDEINDKIKYIEDKWVQNV